MPVKRVNWMIPIILAMMGLGTDFILFYNKVSHTSTACPLGGSCDFVNNSVYSEMFGIPVSVFGLLAFTFFFILAWVAWHKKIDEVLALKVLALFSGLTLVGIAYFVFLMLFVLGAICTWCMFSHLIMLSIFLFAVYHLHARNELNLSFNIKPASSGKTRRK